MMSLKILEQRKNALARADEVTAVVEHAGKPTPGREEILSSLESVLKADRELIFIDRIMTRRGKGESLLRVLVYGRKEDIDRKDVQRAEKRKIKAQGKGQPKKEGE